MQLDSALSFVENAGKKRTKRNGHIRLLSPVAAHMLVIQRIFHQGFYCCVSLMTSCTDHCHLFPDLSLQSML